MLVLSPARVGHWASTLPGNGEYLIRPGPVVPQAPFPRARQLAGLSRSCRVDSQVSGSPRVPAGKWVWLGRLPPPCLPPRTWQLLLSSDKALLDFLCFFLLACPQAFSPTNFSRNSYNFEVSVTSDLCPLGNLLSHKTQLQDQICPWEVENTSFKT